MLKRFVSAASVASVAVACAALVILAVPGISRERVFPLLVVWLCAPAVWGLWSMLAPRAWTPKYLPAWGALLGLFAGTGAALVLNLPARVFGQDVPLGLRAVAALVVVAFYYLLWMVVRRVLQELQPQSGPPDRGAARGA